MLAAAALNLGGLGTVLTCHACRCIAFGRSHASGVFSRRYCVWRPPSIACLVDFDWLTADYFLNFILTVVWTLPHATYTSDTQELSKPNSIALLIVRRVV